MRKTELEEKDMRSSIIVKCSIEDCGWNKTFASRDDFLVFLIRWHDYHPEHNATGNFRAEISFTFEQNKTSFREGDVFIFKTRESQRDSENVVTATAPDGRIAFFDKDAPMFPGLRPGRRIKGAIKVIRSNFIIVQPFEDMGVMERFDNSYAERP